MNQELQKGKRGWVEAADDFNTTIHTARERAKTEFGFMPNAFHSPLILFNS
jgi:hypothetical protein